MNVIINRIIKLPLALISWTIQFFVFAMMGMLAGIFSLGFLIGVLVFGDELDWHLLFIGLVGWWAYYPWLWWYRYFKTGRLMILKEFEEK